MEVELLDLHFILNDIPFLLSRHESRTMNFLQFLNTSLVYIGNTVSNQWSILTRCSSRSGGLAARGNCFRVMLKRLSDLRFSLRTTIFNKEFRSFSKKKHFNLFYVESSIKHHFIVLSVPLLFMLRIESVN